MTAPVLSCRRVARVPFAAWSAVALGLVQLAAPSGPAVADDRVRLGLGLSTYYTDNLLQYSNEQIRVFESGLTPERFSISTIDDVVYRPTVSLTWESSRPHARGREIRLRGTGEFHQSNPTADFHAVSVRWRELLGPDRRLTFGAYYTPRYYLRQLYDEDYVPAYPALSHYRRAEFSLGIASIAWQQRLARRLRGGLGYQYEHRGYNTDFEERTSNTHQGDASLEWYRLPRRGAVEIRAGYRKSLARAEDSDGVANDDPDVSYHGILAGGSGRMDLLRERTWRLTGQLDYEYATRDYDSDRVTDRSHYLRSDRRNTFEASLQCDLPADFGLQGFWHLEDNSADFPPGGRPSGDPGSYTENQLGLALDWSTLLWRGAAHGDAPEGESP